MKKLLFLILIIGLIGKLNAGDLSTQGAPIENKKVSVQVFDPKTRSNKGVIVDEKEVEPLKQKSEMYKAASDKFNQELKQAGLVNSQQPKIETSLSCQNGKLESMPLVAGFTLSFCANNNVDFTEVDKTAVLKLLITEIEQIKAFQQEQNK